MIEDEAVQATEAEAIGDCLGGLVDGTTRVLDELGEWTRSELEHRAHEVRLPAGASIFEIGDTGDALFVVRSGLVDLTTGRAGDRRIITLGPGEIFGEQASLTGRPRGASAVAQTGVTLWRLDHTDFMFLIGTDPQLGASVARVLSERLSAVNRIEMGSKRGQTVLLAAGPPAAAADVCATFTSACARLLHEDPVVLACGPARTWEGTELPTGAVISEPDDLVPAAVRAVREHGLVVLLCGSDIPPVAFAGADRVIFVGEPPAGLSRMRGRAPRILRSLPDAGEVRALAREVCGRRIGLALGAGGIRGWAHAGIVGVLAQEDIPVDFVAGASAGALAGALFVSGMTADAMLEIPTIAREVLSACLRTYRPSAAILSGRPFIRYLRDRLGDDARIEDLPRPLVIATTDIDTREAVYLTSGPLPESIVASSSVNGIFPPVTIGDRRLVDGGASDPVPVAPLRAMGADIVIAVNVMEIGRGAAGIYTPRFRVPLPGLVDNLLIGLDTVITQAAVQSCRMADIVVTPRDAGAKWHEILPAAKYAAAGAAAMRSALPSVRRLLGENSDAA